MRAAVAIAGDIGGGNAAAFTRVAGVVGLVHADAAFLQDFREGIIGVGILAVGGALHEVADGAVGATPVGLREVHVFDSPVELIARQACIHHIDKLGDIQLLDIGEQSTTFFVHLAQEGADFRNGQNRFALAAVSAVGIADLRVHQGAGYGEVQVFDTLLAFCGGPDVVEELERVGHVLIAAFLGQVALHEQVQRAALVAQRPADEIAAVVVVLIALGSSQLIECLRPGLADEQAEVYCLNQVPLVLVHGVVELRVAGKGRNGFDNTLAEFALKGREVLLVDDLVDEFIELFAHGGGVGIRAMQGQGLIVQTGDFRSGRCIVYLRFGGRRVIFLCLLLILLAEPLSFLSLSAESFLFLKPAALFLFAGEAFAFGFLCCQAGFLLCLESLGLFACLAGCFCSAAGCFFLLLVLVICIVAATAQSNEQQRHNPPLAG